MLSVVQFKSIVFVYGDSVYSILQSDFIHPLPLPPDFQGLQLEYARTSTGKPSSGILISKRNPHYPKMTLYQVHDNECNHSQCLILIQ